MPLTNLIIQSKVPHFVTLFGKLEREQGSITAACKSSGVNQRAYYLMKSSNFLTAENARKILAAYKRTSKELS